MNKTGGQAFPNEGFNGWGDPEKGMTLRDYFAAKAMQSALLASCTDENATLAVLNKAKTGLEYEEWLAYSAYAMADAMLKARDE